MAKSSWGVGLMYSSTPAPQAQLHSRLIPPHYHDLRSSALTDEQILQTGHRSISPKQAQELIGVKRPGLLFEYRDPEGRPYLRADGKPFYRLKPDWGEHQGDPPKYLSAKGSGNRPYFSRLQPNWPQILKSHKHDLTEVEGEKKADCLNAHGIPTLGLVGVWGWKDQTPRRGESPPQESRTLPELEQITYQRRKVYQCFDSDIIHKPEVQDALFERALDLNQRGSRPHIVMLPTEADGAKNGPDDFIYRHGIEAYLALQKIAQPSLIFKGLKRIPHLNLSEPNCCCKAVMAWAVLKETWAYRSGVGWYEWAGSHWQLRSVDEFERALLQFSDVQGWLQMENGQLTSIVRQLRSRLLVSENEWGSKSKLAFTNGTLDLDTKQFTPTHDPYDRLYSVMPYDFAPQAQCPRWMQFLQEATGGDLGLIGLLQALCLWVVLPKSRSYKATIERSFDLFGPKGTGKGTFLDVLIQLVGEVNVGPASPDTFKSAQGLGQLIDKKLAIDTDCTGFLEGIGSYNKVVSNEPVEVKKLYRDGYSTRLGVVVVRAYNSFLSVPDGAEGLDRRLTVIPFRHRPQSVDIDLAEKLRAELPGIFAWAWSISETEMKRWILWSGSVGAVAAASIERFEANNPEFRFLLESFPQGAASAKAGDLYRSYVDWCGRNGHQPKSQVKFRPAIETFGCQRSRRISGCFYYGIPAMEQFSVEKHLGIVAPVSGGVEESCRESSDPVSERDRDSWGGLDPSFSEISSSKADSTQETTALEPENKTSTQLSLTVPNVDRPADPTVPGPSRSTPQTSLQVGDEVGKKDKHGWFGRIRGICGTVAEVLWWGDKESTLVSLDQLRLFQVPQGSS